MSTLVIVRTTASATAFQSHENSQPQNRNRISAYFSQPQQPQPRLVRKPRCCGCEDGRYHNNNSLRCSMCCVAALLHTVCYLFVHVA